MNQLRNIMVYLVALAGAMFAASPIQPGDRVAIVGNTFADQLRIHGYFETRLLQRSQGKSISIRNLGWGGDVLTIRDRPTNFPTETSTLEKHKTDVIIACFGMGESFAGEAGLSEFRSDLKAFIASHRGKSYNGKSDVRLILISPIAYENLGAITPNQERRNKELAVYSGTMAAVAAEHKIPFVNLNEPTAALMQEKPGAKLTANGITLNEYGYWAVSRHFADAILPPEPTWTISVDAKTSNAEASGVSVSAVTPSSSGITFEVSEKTWPSLPAPPSDPIHNSLKKYQDVLVVRGLAPATYELVIDGHKSATATSEQLAVGIPLTNTPAHREIEKYRASVNDKNAQFVYSWKALNQVHIVGERRSSPSGKQLPAEVIAFNKLANERDRALQSGISLKSRTWQLIKK